MSDALLIGVDEGSSAVKAAAFDAALRPLAESRREKGTRHPGPGRVEQDPEEILAAVVGAVGELLEELGPDAERVAGCGLDHQGESVLAWRAGDGRALTPVVSWQDKRSTAILERLERDGLADRVAALSGLPLDPYFSAGKLAWLIENEPALRGVAARGELRLGTVDSFLCDRLGAGFETDPSTASRMALGAPQLDAELLAIFGLERDWLPAIRPTCGELGELSHADWRRSLPLRARCVDQQAALAGTGCTRAGMTKATYGTGVFVLANAGPERPDPGGGLLPTIAWEAGERIDWAIDGGVFSAGSLIDFLTSGLGFASDPAELIAAAELAPDSGGVRVLPALAGAGAPWWRPGARGVIAGLVGASTPAQIARAALEAIAWRVADITDLVEDRDPTATLRVDGGLTRSDLLLQLQADASGMPVERIATDATVAGAAALAAVGAGVLDSPAEIEPLIAIQARVEPRLGAGEREAARAEWRGFAERALTL